MRSFNGLRARGALLCLLAALALLQGVPLQAQEAPAPDPRRVEAALRKGADFLVLKYWRGLDKATWHSSAELVLLALSRARVTSEQAGFFGKVQEDLDALPLEYTYRVALLAMTLESLDPVRYRDRIAHCAQWLVETQLEDGEWSYPRWAPQPTHVPPPLSVPGKADSPSAARSFRIKRGDRTVTRKDRGDICNTQFALLGLAACARAGMEIPESTWESARSYFKSRQNQDGSWGYCFGDTRPDAGYASMTCAGVASLALCDAARGRKDFAEDPALKAGLKWIAANFSPSENANIDSRNAVHCRWLYFYLVGVERVAGLLGLPRLGDQDWYAAGSNLVLARQQENGSWKDAADDSKASSFCWDRETVDTCFAMLFLSRGTAALAPAQDPPRR
jgi:hypothetical protein